MVDSGTPEIDSRPLVLGIDPGLRVTGYGLVRDCGDRIEAVEFGAIKTTPSLDLIDRLCEIIEVLEEILQEHKPTCASVEKIFVAVNMKTALTLGHVRGAIVSTIRRHGLPVHEYSPLEIKQATVGYGRAEKHQVADMCRLLLRLDKTPKPADAADALAAAICHLNNSSTSAKLRRHTK